MEVYNFGSVNIDDIYIVDSFVTAGETKSSLSNEVKLGGKGLNQSVALARSGSTVHHVGYINNKDLEIIDFLKSENIMCENIYKVEQATGRAIIQIDHKGENCILLNPGANICFREEDIINVFKGIKNKSLILLQNETNKVDFILKEAKKCGHVTALNMAPVNAQTKKIDLNNVDYLIINQSEGEALTQQKEYEDILNFLLKEYKDIRVILTLGSEGVLYQDKNIKHFVEAISTEVVDTTGAGDTFVGYFLTMIQTASVKESLEIATLASSITIGQVGASNAIPYLDEVKSRSQQNEK